MKKYIYYAAFLLFACNHKTETNETILTAQSDTISSHHEKIPHHLIGKILESIPSPIETSSLIKHEGGLYDNTILNSTDSLKENYHSNFEKALVLGIYGTDLGYVNLYKQNQDALSYLNCIQGLAEELKIGQFFDYHTFKRLSASSNNADSLLYLTVSNFENMNNFLFEQKRSNHSVLILTGGWLEALYISCKIANSNKSILIREKIGEQKIILDQLLVLLSHHQHDEDMEALTKNLTLLKNVYDGVKMEVTYRESKMEEIQGVYVINDQSQSKISISDDQIKEIQKITQSIRDGIII